MQPLFDGDVLAYEASFAAEAKWKYDHPHVNPLELDPCPFDMVADHVDNLIENFCGRVGATLPPILFFTGKNNFRYAIAKRQKYKDRADNKPFHYKNILAYLKGRYEYRITEGLEADDLMAIEQTQALAEGVRKTIICTRDKDLRQVPGLHYGWELANQPEYGPKMVEGLGEITLSKRRDKILGSGTLFFYSQCITGDRVDSIPGLDGEGPVRAYELLKDAKTEEEAFRSVLSAYQAQYGEEQGRVELLEQGRLLWMTRKLNEDGSPVLWELPYD